MAQAGGIRTPQGTCSTLVLVRLLINTELGTHRGSVSDLVQKTVLSGN